MRFLLLAQRIILPIYIDFTWKDNTKKKNCKTLSCGTIDPLKTKSYHALQLINPNNH